MWDCFRIGSHTMLQHGQPIPTSLSQGVCLFRCNLPPALLAEWPGSFTCHCGNTGVEWTMNKSQHTKLIQEKKISLAAPTTFRSRVWCSTNKLSWLPTMQTKWHTIHRDKQCKQQANNWQTVQSNKQKQKTLGDSTNQAANELFTNNTNKATTTESTTKPLTGWHFRHCLLVDCEETLFLPL